MVTVRPGALRHRITIQMRAGAADAIGQVVYTWADVVTVWAEALPLAGRELYAAQQAQSEITVKFRIRYRAGIDDTMRVLWNSVPYDISAPPINVEGRGRMLELVCKNGLKSASATA